MLKLFVEKGVPKDYWQPEGFNYNANAFMKEPDRENKMYKENRFIQLTGALAKYGHFDGLFLCPKH